MRSIARVLLILAVGAITSVAGLTASHAATPGKATCSGPGWSDPGILTSGSYSRLNVSGLCTVADGAHVTVNGSVTL
ncbi:MAG: hypothetical protein ACRDQ1_17955, partial [Sciscionella sp.]